MTTNTAKYDIFEIELPGPSDGNPFLEVELSAEFTLGNRTRHVPGFYDGEGRYRIRFMPDTEGEWRYTTRSDAPQLDGKSGGFTCTPPADGAHGPVQVAEKFHFAYADGTRYFPFGTTCYAWTHQPAEMQAQTLKTLEASGFNKIRMCVFPKDYPYNENPPLHDVYQKDGDGKIDFDRPNPEAFRHFETQIAALMKLGIEADVIVFHPYDRWGYADMSPEQDFRYLKYLCARLSAYRNVWWSLANEYDFLLNTKPMAQWDRYFHIIEENDHVGHLKSIHNGDRAMNYDHRKPWVDHVCIQNGEVMKTDQWRAQYSKPLVNDELQYEGDVPQAWGCITAQELVHRFWITVVRGGYAGHGETYLHPEDLLWWAKGGELRGESWRRVAFLRKIIEESVTTGLTPLSGGFPFDRLSAGRDGDVTFIYLGEHQPAVWVRGLPMVDGDHEVDVIDTWNMTVEPARKIDAPKPRPTRHGAVIRGDKPEAAFAVELPGRPYLALRIREHS